VERCTFTDLGVDWLAGGMKLVSHSELWWCRPCGTRNVGSRSPGTYVPGYALPRLRRSKRRGLSPPGECHRNPAALPFMPAAETPLARIEVLKELLRRRIRPPSGVVPGWQLTRCRAPTNCEIGGSGSVTDFASTSLWDGESTPLCCACQVPNTTYCSSSALPPTLRQNQN